jgi:hypothetical protein
MPIRACEKNFTCAFSVQFYGSAPLI